ncbi:MAG: hypothetical protein JW838_14630 [Spirochaetes bacterium]|nr:hypothetical protein [Spirochaetota bacterium]
MSIDTTINIRMDLFDILMDVEKKSGHARRKIISSLLRRLADDPGIIPEPWERIRYQKRNPNNGWCRFHLLLREDEYEFFLDLRKFFKRSVSFLIAYAIDRYLDEIITIEREFCDNYPYKNYIMSRMVVDKIVCWMLCWGVPGSIITFPRIDSPP